MKELLTLPAILMAFGGIILPFIIMKFERSGCEEFLFRNFHKAFHVIMIIVLASIVDKSIINIVLLVAYSLFVSILFSNSLGSVSWFGWMRNLNFVMQNKIDWLHKNGMFLNIVDANDHRFDMVGEAIDITEFIPWYLVFIVGLKIDLNNFKKLINSIVENKRFVNFDVLETSPENWKNVWTTYPEILDVYFARFMADIIGLIIIILMLVK